MNEFTDHEKVAVLLFGWNQRPSEVWDTEWYTDDPRFDSDCLYSAPPEFTIPEIMDAMAERGFRVVIERQEHPPFYAVNITHFDYNVEVRRTQWYRTSNQPISALESACAAALSAEEVERKDD